MPALNHHHSNPLNSSKLTYLLQMLGICAACVVLGGPAFAAASPPASPATQEEAANTLKPVHADTNKTEKLDNSFFTPTPGPCFGAGFNEFDFWLGEWDVYDDNGALQGHDKIEKIHDNCTLIQHWQQTNDSYRPLGSKTSRYHGISLTTRTSQPMFFPKWTQVWTDNNGLMLVFTGEKNEKGEMVLRTHIDKKEFPDSQMIWSPQADGTIKLSGVYLLADGKEKPFFNYLYKPKSAKPTAEKATEKPAAKPSKSTE